MMPPLLQTSSFVQDAINGVISFIEGILAYLPTLLAAVLVVLVGVGIGKIVERTIEGVASTTGVADVLAETPLGAAADDDPAEVASVLGIVGAFYIYLIALVAAADILNAGPVLDILNSAAYYVPTLLAGVAIVLLGAYVGRIARNMVEDAEAVRESGFASLAGGLTEVFVYFLAITIGLDTIGIEVGILYQLVDTVALGLVLALALALGLAFGLGGQERAAETIDGWTSESTADGAASDQSND